MTALVEVREIAIRFGGIAALDGVSFDVQPGLILGLIGPNGAGKTTLFNCVSGLYHPTSGDIRFDGRSLLVEPPHRRAHAGIARTFQNLALFDRLSVRENVLAGSHATGRGSYLSDALGLIAPRRDEAARGLRVDALLASLDLATVADRPVAGLPFGTLKRVELARALASHPRLLLLDEPAGGLNHDEVASLGELIRRIRDEYALTILLVEHHMGLVMAICDRVVALDFGRKIAEGPPAEVRRNPDLVAAYLGSAA